MTDARCPVCKFQLRSKAHKAQEADCIIRSLQPLLQNEPKICKGCRSPFWCKSLRQQRCKKDCKRVDKRRGRRYRRVVTHFVAVDGEGVNINGEHRYVLLSVGSESLHHDGAPLTHEDIWEFLWEQFCHDDTATFVGFFLGYDFTQWLRSLPEERANMLLSRQGRAARSRTKNKNPTPFPVRHGKWEFDMLPHRRFKIRPQEGDQPWLYVCDAGAFFQSSFLTAIDPTHWKVPIVSPAELELIVAGKQQRADARFGQEMIEYNVIENVVMARLMDSLHAGLTEIGVSLKRSQYFGPGQAASEWLKSTECIDREEYTRTTPRPVRAGAIASYYGGWFEIRRHGRVSGISYQYDINSAYPHIISRLPCLKHGRWEMRNRAGHKTLDTPYVLLNVELQGSAAFGPAPYRNERGAILRPQSVKGWYWKHEVEAAYAAGLVDEHRIIQSWSYIPCDCEPPLAKVADLYDIRLRAGKDTSIGRACKLVYNSIYGKFAQSAGMPRWANPVYASLITAGCRAQILEAIASHGTMPSMIATDSVLFTEPHSSLAVSQKLGDWSEKEMYNVTLFAPGVYWDDAARKRIRDGKSVTLKSRGVAGPDIAQMVNYADYAFDTWTPEQEWPSVTVPIKFDMISCEQALAWHKWHLAGNQRNGTVRTLSSESLPKRATPRFDGLTRGMLQDDRSWYSLPWPPDVFPDESIPYSRTFGESIEDWGETQDGDIQSLFREALMGS